MNRWIFILSLIPALAGAQNVGVAGGGTILGASPRTTTICLVPDIQNMTSMSDGVVANPSVDCSQTEGAYCTGASCVSSPYCSASWWQTGRILLDNMAYSLTGQWSAIDYTAVKHADNVLSKRGHALDHGRCDAIIGLGDNMDTTDLRTYAQLTSDMVHQYEMAIGFWRIVKASGIPYIIARGNHDGEGAFDTLITALGVESEPFHYAIHSERDQYAIKFSTKTGKDFCALTLDDDAASEVGDEYTASEAAWVLSNVGCGSDLPTILVGHEIVISDAGATLLSSASTVTLNAGAGEVFIVAGGHYTDSAISRKVEGTNGSGAAIFKFFSNWQEMNRHNTNLNGNGITTSDGNGGMYTVISVDAGNSRICAHDWTPYWQSRGTVGNGQDTTQLASSTCFNFNFDTRFP